MRVFDDFDRTDASPASHEEDGFAFLNRAAGDKWEATRRLVEEWFAEFPSDGQADLRGRYRSKLPGSHLGAWWELYLHRLMTGLGYDVEVHPEVVCSSKRPDFRISRGEQIVLYLEAAVVFSGIVDRSRDGTREGWILDALNGTSSDDFFVSVEFLQVGQVRPKSSEVTRPVDEWLASLDADRAFEAESPDEYPTRTFAFRGWRIELTAIALSPEMRGPNPDRRLVGFGPVLAGFIDDQTQIRDTAKKKGSRYGSLDAPLVVALNATGSFPDAEDFGNALFGDMAYEYEIDVPGSGRAVRRRNGVWMEERGPARTRLSGVLAGTQIHPHTVGTAAPTLWTNPWAERPLSVEWPFAEGSAADNGLIEFRSAEPDMGSILGLD